MEAQKYEVSQGTKDKIESRRSWVRIFATVMGVLALVGILVYGSIVEGDQSSKTAALAIFGSWVGIWFGTRQK